MPRVCRISGLRGRRSLSMPDVAAFVASAALRIDLVSFSLGRTEQEH